MELSEIREQNELLEFRLLELEEAPTRRDSPDHAMDSGIVSPEPAHANKVSPSESFRCKYRIDLCQDLFRFDLVY